MLEADPEAILRYNDYSLEDPAKRRKLIALIKSLQAQHVPVMAIGSQAHVNVSTGFETMDQARVAPAVPTICISIRQATGSWESDTGKECSHCSVFTSRDGLHDWTNRGVPYDPREAIVRYPDSTVNHWKKAERPSVYIENGHVAALGSRNQLAAYAALRTKSGDASSRRRKTA